MNIETYKIKNSDRYINLELFINDLKNLLIPTKYIYNIEKNKTYYSNNLNTPKNRINIVKEKYNLKKVLDIHKADYIFSDTNTTCENISFRGINVLVYFNTVQPNAIAHYRGINTVFDASLNTNNPTCVSRFESWKQWTMKAGKFDLIDDSLTLVIRTEDAKKLYDIYSKYTIDKPFVDLSLLVEEDLPLLLHTDFVSDYLDKLKSTNAQYMTLLTLYNYYNIQSVKVLFRLYFSSNKFGRTYIDTLIKNYKSKDVYTKYLLESLTNITTNRTDLKKLYYWNRIKSRYTKQGWNIYDNKNIYIKTKQSLHNTIIKIKAKYIIENEK